MPNPTRTSGSSSTSRTVVLTPGAPGWPAAARLRRASRRERPDRRGRIRRGSRPARACPQTVPDLHGLRERAGAVVPDGHGELLLAQPVTVQVVAGIQTFPLVSSARTSKGRRPCLLAVER